MTASAQDEKIARLIAQYGHAGYGTWWLVLEAVAARLESGGHPSVTYPVNKWSHLLSVRGSLVSQCLSKLEVTHLVTVERDGSDITVTIPNLLKYRDEWSRKSKVTPESLRSKEQIQIQIQNNTCASGDARQGNLLDETPPHGARVVVRPDVPSKKKLITSQQEIWFAEWWAIYWRKRSRGDAEKAFGRHVKSEEIFRKVLAATKAQTPEMLQRSEEYRKHGASWLNARGWEDETTGGPSKPAYVAPSRNYVDIKALIG